jgi:mono/diheme cytochrome c family protein
MSTRPILLAAWGLATLAFALAIGRSDGRSARADMPKVTPLAVPLDVDLVGDPILQGASIARSPGGARVYVADEPNESIYVATEASTLTGSEALPTLRVKLPGRPAQLVALGQHVLVTVRDPSMLISLRPDATSGLIEEHRVALAGDAWGLAVTEDQQTAVVTSAWTHVVSGVDLSAHAVRWTVDVDREPRGVALRPEGKIAYVSHLTSGTITAIERIDGDKPIVHAIDLPVATLAARKKAPIQASLGYALVLSTDATRLFAPRHALGEVDTWQGTLTVDALRTPLDAPLLPPIEPALVGRKQREDEWTTLHPTLPAFAGLAGGTGVPRTAVLRATTKTLLVAGEGFAQLTELDARSLAPALHPLHRYVLAGCAAPDGIVLSRDEATAFVHCSASFEIRRVVLHAAFEYIAEDDDWQPEGLRESASIYAHDPLSKEAALGRRLFADATDDEISGGFPCSGCHPDGRDDGHVWSEVSTDQAIVPGYFGGALQPRVLNASPLSMAMSPGVPRQTPMLAGRVAGVGPYGWTAESKTLMNRIERGMRLHRWFGAWMPGVPFTPTAHEKARALVAFVREGLVAPPSHDAELDVLEARGKEIFEGSGQCASCHSTAADVSTLGTFKLAALPTPGFLSETKTTFKAPGLRFLSGSAPYLHDGSARSLEELVEKNDDRMGLTNQLDAGERMALVAYLRTL